MLDRLNIAFACQFLLTSFKMDKKRKKKKKIRESRKKRQPNRRNKRHFEFLLMFHGMSKERKSETTNEKREAELVQQEENWCGEEGEWRWKLELVR